MLETVRKTDIKIGSFSGFLKKNFQAKNFTSKKPNSVLKYSGRPFFDRPTPRPALSNYSFFTFQVFPNNVFCTLKSYNEKKFYLHNVASAGKYNISISKKTLKHKLKFVVTSFLKEIKNKELELNQFVGIKAIAPAKMKKRLIQLLTFTLKKKNFAIESIGKKQFNGCRARKKIRKKRKGLRLFKY